MANTMNNATINTSVNVENKEDNTMMNMKKKELVAMAKKVGVKGYSKMNKTDLVAAIKFFTDEERKETEAVVAPVVEGSVAVAEEPVVEEKKTEEVSDMKQKYMDTKWDRLVNAVVAEYIKQSVNVKWALFYRNTKSTITKSKYLVKSSKLWGATSKVIKSLYGDKNCNEKNIKQTLNALVIRGYLTFKEVEGNNGNTNIIFSSSTTLADLLDKAAK